MFGIVEDDDPALDVYYKQVGRIVKLETKTVELDFGCIFLLRQVRFEPSTTEWIATLSDDQIASLFQIPQAEEYIQGRLKISPFSFSWNELFATVLYPIRFQCREAPIIDLNDTKKDFSELYYTYVLGGGLCDQCKMLAHEYGDQQIDITTIALIAREKRYNLQAVFYTYVQRKIAENAVIELSQLYNPKVYFDSTTEYGQNLILEQIQRFNYLPNQDFKIGKSTYGLGLFVKRDFLIADVEETIFGEYLGFVVTQDLANRLPYRFDKVVVLDKVDKAIVPEIARRDGSQFNYFCYANDPGYEGQPNIAFKQVGQKMYIVPLKGTYTAGEELLLDYGLEYWRYVPSYWKDEEQRQEAFRDLEYWANLKKDNLEDVVEKVNKQPGPRVKRVIFANGAVGYGLFAERDYGGDDFVTNYGGVEVPSTYEGPYTVSISEKAKDKKTQDSEFEFDIRDKGRWVNEGTPDPKDRTKTREKLQNVTLKYGRPKNQKGKKRMYFATTKPVKRGEEFYWDYSRFYKRTW